MLRHFSKEVLELLKPFILPSAPRTRCERRAGLAVTVAAVLLLVYLLTYDPQEPLIQTPPCLFRTITGLFCPGCGTRSALIQLARGNLYAAWRLNPLAILTVPLGIYFVISQAYIAFTGRSLPRLFLPPFWIWALFILILLYGVARNLPFYPFTLIRPTIV